MDCRRSGRTIQVVIQVDSQIIKIVEHDSPNTQRGDGQEEGRSHHIVVSLNSVAAKTKVKQPGDCSWRGSREQECEDDDNYATSSDELCCSPVHDPRPEIPREEPNSQHLQHVCK